MKAILTAAVFGCFVLCTSAQSPREKEAIKGLCGCFEVEFMYAETFAPDEEYEFPKRYHVGGLEWVVPVESSDKKIVIQHLLQISDTMIIKHWREDWEYEKKDWWVFNHDASWKHVEAKKPVSGEWTQTVWEVDDGPRYQGSSKWVETNNKYYWENTADAPLPRREYTKRKDYNVMQRTNRIISTDTGWVHEQDNKKYVRADGAADKLISQEKGYNIYRKTDDSKCAVAAAWWAKHKDFWVTVRDKWASMLKNKTEIKLTTEIDGERLYEKLDKLEAQNLSGNRLKEQVGSLLEKYASKDYQPSSVSTK